MNMADVNARSVALDVLRAVQQRGAFADAMLGRALNEGTLTKEEDRRLATQLVYGVLAQKLRLDHTIEAYSAHGKLDRNVGVALRIGLYQLAFLARVPAYAAVDTTVALVRRFAPHASGFVNAHSHGVGEDGAVRRQCDAVH